MEFPKSYDVNHAMILKKTNYQAYKKYCMDKEILPDEFIEKVAERYKDHIMDPKNVVISGTINANRVKKTKNNQTSFEPEKVVHILNTKTNLNLFYNESSKSYISGWELDEKQLDELKTTGNLM